MRLEVQHNFEFVICRRSLDNLFLILSKHIAGTDENFLSMWSKKTNDSADLPNHCYKAWPEVSGFLFRVMRLTLALGRDLGRRISLIEYLIKKKNHENVAKLVKILCEWLFFF